jgi:phage terminase large subunit
MPKPLKASPEEVNELMEYYRDGHQVEFVREILGRDPWEKQREIIKDVFNYKIVSVASCNAAGKSDVASDIALAFLTIHPDSIVITTAPTWRQVKDVLWRYIRTKYKKSIYKLSSAECNQVGLDYGEEWYAIGLSTTDSEKFFGYHADNILVIIDEASGVDEKIFIGVDAVTPNVNAHVLCIGNPTNPSGRFYKWMHDPLVKKHTITVFDTPNFTANNIKNVDDLLELFTPPDGVDAIDHVTAIQKSLIMPINALISPETVYRRYFEWGTDNPAWQALIMGQFPSQASQSLFPTELVQMAMGMTGTDDDPDSPHYGESYAKLAGWIIPDGPMEYGLDMARYGDDNTVLIPRHGGWVNEPIAWGKTSLMESADRVLDQIDPLNPDVRVNIDDTGNGGGTTDRLRQLSSESFTSGDPAHQYQLGAYNFSSKEYMMQPEKFHDITSELYWKLRDWFINKRIAIPYNERLFNELIARRWRVNPSSGKIQVESKDDYKKRTGGKSPDYSDALALAFAGGLRKFQLPPTPEQEEEHQESIRPRFTSGISRKGW